MNLGEVVCYIELLLDDLAVTSSAAVEICPVLISDLAPGLAAAILSPLNEPRVPVSPDDPVVQPGAVDVPQRVLRVLSAVILDKTEAAGRPLELVQAHHHPLDLAAHPKQLVDLLLCGVEGHVADIQGGGLVQQPLLLPSRALIQNSLINFVSRSLCLSPP